MKTALIHVFSGTGNARRAARLVTAVLQSSGYRIAEHQVERSADSPGDACDLHVFLFPVHAFSVPHIMKRSIRRLPSGHQEPAAVIAVHGEASVDSMVPGYAGQAFEQARRMLERKGYHVFLTDSAGYPVNLSVVANSPSPEAREEIFRNADAKVTEIAGRIADQTDSLKNCRFLTQIWTWLVGILFSLFGRRMIGKLYIADRRCDGCEFCVKTCPANAIRLVWGRPRWNYDCEGCMRCINLCPLEAIQVSLARLAVMVGLIFVHLSRPLLFDVELLGGMITISFTRLLRVLLYTALFYAADKLLFFLDYLPPFRSVLSVNYTHRIRRYREPQFKPDEHT